MRNLASRIVLSRRLTSASRRRGFLVLFCALLIASFTFASTQERSSRAARNLSIKEDLNSPKCVVGVKSGAASSLRAREFLPQANIKYYSDANALFNDLRDGRIDAVVYEKPYLERLTSECSDFVILPGSFGEARYSFAFSKKQRELVIQVNEFIEIIKGNHSCEETRDCWQEAFAPVKSSSDSVYGDMKRRWFLETDSEQPEIPTPQNPVNEGNPYVVGLVLNDLAGNGDESFNQISGFEQELLKRLALFLDVEISIQPVNYKDAVHVAHALKSKRYDFAIGSLYRTPELESEVLFSDDYAAIPIAVMTLRKNGANGRLQNADYAGVGVSLENSSFMRRMKRSFEKTFLVENRWKLFVSGLLCTIYITIVATALGTLMAVGQCYMRRSKHAWLRYPAKIYIAIMQGTPILVILLVLYYVVFTKISLSGELVAAIALALNFAAYAGEQMRTGVDGIDKGLIEAARALGFGRFNVFCKVIFPIACRRIMPVYKGEFISLLKSTSIVGYVAIQDLTKASDIVRGRTYEAFFPLVATAIIYLITAHLLASGFAYLEYRLDPVTRRKRAKGEVNV